MATVRIEGLRKAYGGTTVVDDFSIEVASGEFVTLLGQSGCGKTTTLRCIAGLESADGGRIHIDDQLVCDGDRGLATPPEKRRIGMVFQSYALWPHMSVLANVSYPLRVSGVRRREANARAQATLDTLGLGHLAHRPATSLSGGQQQRVALGRAVVGEPRVVLFDEPLSNLDPTLRQSVRAEIKRLHDRSGGTSVYVTHDLEEALTLSDRIIVMDQGRVQQIAGPEEVFGSPVNRFVARFVGFENFLDVVVDSRSDDGTVVRLESTGERVVVGRVVDAVPGQEMVLAFRTNHAHPAEPGERGVTVVVERSQYMGEYVEIEGEVGGERIVLTARAGRAPVQHPYDLRGASLQVAIDRDAAILLPRDGSPSPTREAAQVSLPVDEAAQV